MRDFTIHRAGDRYVIDAGADAFSGLRSLVLGLHMPNGAPPDEPWMVALRAVINDVSKYLPGLPSYETSSKKIDGVDFVSVSSRIVFSADALVARRLADCLERVVLRGEVRDLQSLTGLWFTEIRGMYMVISAALGRFKHARVVAFGQ